jgi:hypothetical protein
MVAAQNLCGTFTDDDARSHRISGGDAWHDRSVRYTKIVNSVDSKAGIDHRHGIAPHFRGAGLMVVSDGGIPDEGFQCPSL